MGARLIKVADKFSLIVGRNRGRFPFCNVFLAEKFLIDAGAGIEIIQELVKRANCLILSHTHPDHASGAWIFNEASKAVLAPMNFPTDIDSLAVRFVTEKFAETWKQFVTSPLVGMKSFKADKYNEGIISTEPEIEAIFAPGHSVDHHVFLINGKILFGSDIDLTSFGPWYGNPESDPWLFKKSIEMLLNLDFDVFISAHDNPVFGRDEIERRVINFLEFFEKRDERLLSLLKIPRSIEELVEISPIYGRKPFAKEMLDFFERTMIEKHLSKLEIEGKVRREGEKYCRILR